MTEPLRAVARNAAKKDERKGWEERTIEIAKAMLAAGDRVKKIMTITGLARDGIEMLSPDYHERTSTFKDHRGMFYLIVNPCCG